MRVGILAVQGGFEAHARVLERLGHETQFLRDPGDFRALDGLVLPGGESTAQLRLIERFGLTQGLRELVSRGKPVLATCAGLILAAKRVECPEQASFGWIDVQVQRNAFGRQLDSFEDRSDQTIEGDQIPMMFIRAPRMIHVGPGVEVILTWHGEPVLVRSGAFHAASFHPELTSQAWVHRCVFGGAEPRHPGIEGQIDGHRRVPRSVQSPD